ncbi:putative RNA-binding protein with PIN domain [Olsenella profusa DSM 13989]|uniref:NYN domain-containing protein n=1 Tax=Olsenella profusa TaxID=138595 RepID=UPI0027819AE3|nr:NYN domain-containing protein [Olsenella profusa]MDP9858730.1 putative RNA-binding protein with PIN domain [Olsenella profusa DSM 13989]
MPRQPHELLVVDGYNVIHKSPRYTVLMDETDPGDPFERSRERLVADVATYAQGRYEATIVFDAAGNVSPDRPNLSRAGVRIIFSQAGESADTVIERLVTSARLVPRAVTVVTSDNTIRATVGGVPVTRVSSDVLVTDVKQLSHEMERERVERTHQHLTLEDRLDPATRARLDRMLGRS